MTEPKPTQQYDAGMNTDILTKPIEGGNGQIPAEPTIDEQSRQTAMARAMIENGLVQRENACGAEINAAVQDILKKYRCTVTFLETRDIANDRVMKVWLQPVAIERIQREPGQ